MEEQFFNSTCCQLTFQPLSLYTKIVITNASKVTYHREKEITMSFDLKSLVTANLT